MESGQKPSWVSSRHEFPHLPDVGTAAQMTFNELLSQSTAPSHCKLVEILQLPIVKASWWFVIPREDQTLPFFHQLFHLPSETV